MKMRCITCHRPATLCEETNRRRIYCGQACQKQFHIGLKTGRDDAGEEIDDPTIVGFQTSKGRVFRVPIEIVRKFKVIAEMFNNNFDNYIPLPNVSGPTFEIILEYLQRKVDFYDAPPGVLLNVARAAIYLNVEEIVLYNPVIGAIRTQLLNVNSADFADTCAQFDLYMLYALSIQDGVNLTAFRSKYAKTFSNARSDVLSLLNCGNPYLWACASGNVSLADFILRRGGVLVDERTEGQTLASIIEGTYNGEDYILKSMLKYKQGDGKYYEIIKLLLDRGLKTTSRIFAASIQRLEMLQLLIDKGRQPPPDLLKFAIDLGKDDVVAYLRNLGPSKKQRNE